MPPRLAHPVPGALVKGRMPPERPTLNVPMTPPFELIAESDVPAPQLPTSPAVVGKPSQASGSSPNT